jgi:hypothetical protein
MGNRAITKTWGEPARVHYSTFSYYNEGFVAEKAPKRGTEQAKGRGKGRGGREARK